MEMLALICERQTEMFHYFIHLIYSVMLSMFMDTMNSRQCMQYKQTPNVEWKTHTLSRPYNMLLQQ